ncbi:GNAT family N-acetyltransferase [Actinomadura nitritigenes]|uniref:GNAT family N-acetyltransferase n=1 Tax=Actinomadura nitritigenes TaxID=134602 RepID=UPI003D920F90
MDDVLRLDGKAALSLRAEIAELYRRCYELPPWSETPAQIAAYPGKLAASARRPAFAAWLVRVRDELAGICYGWPTPHELPNDRIYAMLTRAAGADRALALTRGAFEVAELFVHPDHRGRGLGEALLTSAVAGWDSAWLITHPGAPAARLYRRLGWRQALALPADFYPQLPMAVYTLGPADADRRASDSGADRFAGPAVDGAAVARPAGRS